MSARYRGTETSDLAGYTVEFAGTVDAEGKLTATVKLTEIPASTDRGCRFIAEHL